MFFVFAIMSQALPLGGHLCNTAASALVMSGWFVLQDGIMMRE
jgi:hypothetical protein